MRRLLACALLLAAACSRAPAPETRKTAVLFVGDSLMGAGDMPRVFAQVAASRGDPVDVVGQVMAGSKSTFHSALDSRAFAEQKLPSRTWDFAVLQEHSLIPSLPAPVVDEQITPYAKRLAESIRAGAPKARLVYLVTWGFKDGDTYNCAALPDNCTYGGMQDRLVAAYEEMARANAGALAPVGQAWRRVRQGRPEIELYADDHHPSAQGTYLAACVLYGALFKKKSAGADPAGLEPSRAAVLQEAADAAVFDPQGGWDRFARRTD